MSSFPTDPSKASSQGIARTSIIAGVIAAAFALSGFTVSLFAGLSSGNSASEILFRSIIVLLVCYPLGLAAGWICQYVVQRHIEEHEAANPLPEPTEEVSRMMAESLAENSRRDDDAIDAGSGEGVIEV